MLIILMMLNEEELIVCVMCFVTKRISLRFFMVRLCGSGFSFIGEMWDGCPGCLESISMPFTCRTCLFIY